MNIEKPALQAFQGEKGKHVPFWLMRQAGRYLPEYRALRAKAGSFLDLCYNPDFAVEVTLQPLRRFDMDAAILFSDILVIPHALMQPLRFEEGEGPRLEPVRCREEFEALAEEDMHARLAPIYETVRGVRAGLDGHKTLIGFAGAPFTVACYMIDGKGGGFPITQKFAQEQADDFLYLLDKLANVTASYLAKQIENGADCVMLFDSWAGLVTPLQYDAFIVEPARKIAGFLKQKYPHVPLIGFPRGSKDKYGHYAQKTGVAAMGVDYDITLTDVKAQLKTPVTLQGNLSPEILLEGGQKMEDAVRKILEEARDIPFVFNLGHGIIKETPPEHVAKLAEIIKGFAR